jgi:hypothetical protein
VKSASYRFYALSRSVWASNLWDGLQAYAAVCATMAIYRFFRADMAEKTSANKGKEAIYRLQPSQACGGAAQAWGETIPYVHKHARGDEILFRGLRAFAWMYAFTG